MTINTLMVDISRGGLISRRQVRLDDLGWPSRVEQMVHLGVEVLICGGISNFLYHQLVARGIQVIPWVTGDVEEVLQAYLQDQLNQEKFAMPGCRRWRHRHRGGP